MSVSDQSIANSEAASEIDQPHACRGAGANRARLDDCFANLDWNVRHSPFRHCLVENLLAPAAYESVCEAFERRLTESGKQVRRAKDYDAKILSLTQNDCESFFPLLDFGVLSRLAHAMGLDVSFEMDAAMHCHPPGSRSGWIHTDYNPGWFIRAADPGEVLLVDLARCNYRTGQVRGDAAKAVLRMRHLAFIYYLNNDDWSVGDGGETGLYSGRQQDIENPDVIVAPRNNTMLMFECSPHSCHAFLAAKRERNSVILWLHRHWDSARAAWPDHEPEYW